jgi:hypothetical protein
MTHESLLDDCVQSISRLLLSNRNGIRDEDTRRTANLTLQETLRTKQFVDPDKHEICSNCLNIMHPKILDRLVKDIGGQLDSLLALCRTTDTVKDSSSSSSSSSPLATTSVGLTTGNDQPPLEVQLQFVIPSVLDVPRVATRTFVTQQVEKVVSFSTFDLLVEKMLSTLLPLREGVRLKSDAEIVVLIKPRIDDQLAMCMESFSEFRIKKNKRRFGDKEPEHEDDENDISRQNIGECVTRIIVQMCRSDIDNPFPLIDKVLLHFKTLDQPKIAALFRRLTEYLGRHQASATPLLSFFSDVHYIPLYLFGRYCKFARDVPQSPWTLTPATKSNVCLIGRWI